MPGARVINGRHSQGSLYLVPETIQKDFHLKPTVCGLDQLSQACDGGRSTRLPPDHRPGIELYSIAYQQSR